MLTFEWDEVKNMLNRRKHGVWFEEAQSVLDDPLARIFVADDHSDDEDRFLIIGANAAEKILIVAHCYRKAASVIRLISARKATRKESKTHEKRV